MASHVVSKSATSDSDGYTTDSSTSGSIESMLSSLSGTEASASIPKRKADGRPQTGSRKKARIVEEIVSDSSESDYSDVDVHPLNVSPLVKGGCRIARRSAIHYYTRESRCEAQVHNLLPEGLAHYMCPISVRHALMPPDELWYGGLRIPKAYIDNEWNSHVHEAHSVALLDLSVEEEHQVFDEDFYDRLFGRIKLGDVVGENRASGTYIRQATYYIGRILRPWECCLQVPKASVPQWALIDWEGKQDSVRSIEVPSDEQKIHEQEQSRTYSIRFTRFIEDDGIKHMKVDMRDAEGRKCASKCEAYIKVTKVGPEEIFLDIRVDLKHGESCHLRDTMNKNLLLGRFIVTEPLPGADKVASMIRAKARLRTPRIQLPLNAPPTQVLPDPDPSTRVGPTWPGLSKLKGAGQQEGSASERQEHPIYGFKGIR